MQLTRILNDHSNSNVVENIEIPYIIQGKKIKKNLGKINGYLTKNQGQIANCHRSYFNKGDI